MQLFSEDATIFSKKKKNAHKKLKKPPPKVAQKTSNPLFLSYPNGPNRKIHDPNCGL